MKYTILGYQQKALLDFELDVIDALLIRTVTDMFVSKKMDFIQYEGNTYLWVNYTYLSKQIPILGSKRSLMRRIKKLEDLGFVKRVLKHMRKGVKGSFAYITFTEKYELLNDYDVMTHKGNPYDDYGKGLGQDDITVKTNTHNKDSSLKDSSLYDSSSLIVHSDEIEELAPYVETPEDVFLKLWNLYPNKKGKGSISNKTKKEIFKLGENVFEKCIERYVEYVMNKRKTFPSLNYKNGSTFFNSGYIDYLDENYQIELSLETNEAQNDMENSTSDLVKEMLEKAQMG